jgi:hypothetical protein
MSTVTIAVELAKSVFEIPPALRAISRYTEVGQPNARDPAQVNFVAKPEPLESRLAAQPAISKRFGPPNLSAVP